MALTSTNHFGQVVKAVACGPRGHEFESCCCQPESFAYSNLAETQAT